MFALICMYINSMYVHSVKLNNEIQSIHGLPELWVEKSELKTSKDTFIHLIHYDILNAF